MSDPVDTPSAGACTHVNHTHGRERRGMPVHCFHCGLIAPGHEQRMETEERLAGRGVEEGEENYD